MLCILLSVSFCMSYMYNHVYKTIYCTYIEYALLCNVKMICERRANAGIGLCWCACRSWPLLSAKYKYKHVAIQRVICVLSIDMGDLQLSGSECAGVQSDGDRCNSWYRPSQRPERELTWSGLDTWSTVDLFSYACPQTVLCIIHLYIYYCVREIERETETEKERVHTFFVPFWKYNYPNTTIFSHP